MSDTQVFVLCLMMAEYFALGIIAGVTYRVDINSWLRKKLHKDGL